MHLLAAAAMLVLSVSAHAAEGFQLVESYPFRTLDSNEEQVYSGYIPPRRNEMLNRDLAAKYSKDLGLTGRWETDVKRLSKVTVQGGPMVEPTFDQWHHKILTARHYSADITIEYPNGARITRTVTVQSPEFLRGFAHARVPLEMIENQIEETIGFANADPAALSAELRWMRDRLTDGFSAADKPTQGEVAQLVAKLDAVKPPPENAEELRAWIGDNFGKYDTLKRETRALVGRLEDKGVAYAGKFVTGAPQKESPAALWDLDWQLEHHAELTHPLEGQKIAVALKAEGVTLEYANGITATLPGAGQDLVQAVRGTAGMAALRPADVDAELRWIRQQLVQGSAVISEDDAAIIKELIGRIDAIKPPEFKFGRLFKKVIPARQWMAENYPKFEKIRQNAVTWGTELNFDVISFENRAAPAAGARGFADVVVPVKSSDRVPAQKLWDSLERRTELRDVLDKYGGTVKVSFDEPVWAIAPADGLKGRAAVRATVTVVRGDGVEKVFSLTAKANTELPLPKLMTSEDWLKPMTAEFQNRVANAFVEIDQFLAAGPSKAAVAARIASNEPAETKALRARLGALEEAPEDCDAAVDDVIQVLGR